jgi:hypothetical protein
VEHIGLWKIVIEREVYYRTLLMKPKQIDWYLECCHEVQMLLGKGCDFDFLTYLLVAVKILILVK